MGAEDLSAALWKQRSDLELLQFRLDTQALHAGDETMTWLKITAADIESVVERLNVELLSCHVESAAVASLWGAPPSAPLPALIVFAPPGVWPTLLGEHLAELRRLYAAIQAGSAANRLAFLQRVEAAAPQASAPVEPDADLAALLAGGTVARAKAAAKSTDLPLLAQYLGLA